MERSANLDLPYIMPSQAQKHVTHNEAIRALDAVVQLSVLDRTLTEPPASPVEGDRHIIAAGATDAWIAKDNQIAAWQDGAWAYFPPQEGWLAWSAADNDLFVWNGAAWNAASSGGSVNPASLVGVNATADTTNRLSVASSAALFSHDGNDHRLKINKNAGGDTASVLYQTGFSGRAELGLTGDDNFHLRTSPDGAAWTSQLSTMSSRPGVASPCISSSEIEIAADSVGVISTPRSSGFFFMHISDSAYPQLLHSAILIFDTGLSLAMPSVFVGGGVTNQGATLLTGSTGPTGKTNIAVQHGQILIENRAYTTSQTFSFVILS